MRLHARGLELVVELLEAAEHVDRLTVEEQRTLLVQAAEVMGELLARDSPWPEDQQVTTKATI